MLDMELSEELIQLLVDNLIGYWYNQFQDE
jgi:hypothetical protein